MVSTNVPGTQTEPNMKPDYEVKLLLNTRAVLTSTNELIDSVLSTFNMPTTSMKLNFQFLDTNSKDLYTASWIARIRKPDNQDDFELTYKRRYAISGGNIDAALTAANHDGFNAGSKKYKAQVDWGYSKQTLSISRDKTFADPKRSKTDLPGTSDSRKMLIDEAPDKFANWKLDKWGTTVLAESRIFGPLLTRRFIGLWNKMPLDIEILPIRNLAGTEVDYIVEASFKTKSHTTALTEQSNLAAFLKSKDWLLAEDSLKTQLIMDRY
ncbi:hypothetical protein N7495_006679 [Penicillium taxi]|uniref:uncharacterized protein n=1 Tax=Penicillium taxi TaxID=168475 RepID=UPI00254543B7|nr:uncharacterized protein N7495_006679 [Penicillium taxi]KAJ5894988.1 hypothetical protein N7495_006679 [Penicillium taxi]